MYTKVEYLQYIKGMKEAEESMVQQLKDVLSLTKDSAVTEILKQILAE